MGQFSVEKPVAPGSVLSGNQQAIVRLDSLLGASASISSLVRGGVTARALE